MTQHFPLCQRFGLKTDCAPLFKPFLFPVIFPGAIFHRQFRRLHGGQQLFKPFLFPVFSRHLFVRSAMITAAGIDRNSG